MLDSNEHHNCDCSFQFSLCKQRMAFQPTSGQWERWYFGWIRVLAAIWWWQTKWCCWWHQFESPIEPMSLFVPIVTRCLVSVCTNHRTPSMAMAFALLPLLLLSSCLFYWPTSAVEIRPYCGFPGKPYRAKIIPEEKVIFDDGEEVTYQCADYWAPPQSRKCIKGVWVGPMARCGDFVSDLLMKSSQAINMNTGELVFEHHDMVLVLSDWRYPNSFTSTRFKKARLQVTNDQRYAWTFNFTKPVVKLFVKINYNFINFTHLTESEKKSFKFDVQVEISPHRVCTLEFTSHNPWRDDGVRVDSYFICQAKSYEHLLLDIASPSNYLYVQTQSSMNISHDLVAVFFGKVYGTNEEPLCGEPETEYGQSFRPNQEYRDYIIDCLNKEEWVDTTPTNIKMFNYFYRCYGDMTWNGTRPMCMPTKTCPMTMNKDFEPVILSNRTDMPVALKVDSIAKCLYLISNDSVYATVGTELIYSCLNEDYVLLGKDTRTCKRDFKWSGNEPVCKCEYANEDCTFF